MKCREVGARKGIPNLGAVMAFMDSFSPPAAACVAPDDIPFKETLNQK
jgi:hypothetical protein